MKTCRVCQTEKPPSDFYARKESRDGRCHECKACLGARTSKNQKADHAGRRAKVDRWQATNREKSLELKRKYYADRKDYYLAKGREYRKSSPHLHRARIARRRAAKLCATPPWADREEIKAIYEQAAIAGMQVDHIHPLQGETLCGLHVPWNLQLLTATDNQRKSNKFETRPAKGAHGHDQHDPSESP